MCVVRVLILSRQFYPWVGGIEKLAQHLAEKMIERGIDVRIVTGWWFKGTPHREVIDGVPVTRIFSFWGMFGIRGLRKFGAYACMLNLLWYLVRHRREYDLIHCFAVTDHSFVAVLASRLLGKKILIAGMASGPFGDIQQMWAEKFVPGQRFMLPTIVRHADYVVALNDQMAQEMLAAGFPPGNIRRVPDGVETDGIPIKTDYRLDHSATLTFVGRLHPQKGPDLAIQAFSRVVETRPDVKWRLFMIGDGRMRQELEAAVCQLGLSERVEFCGIVDNLPDYWAQTDIYIHSSRGDGMSLALLAALASGLPTVATRISGNVAVIADNENGLLAEPEDADGLSRAILQLFSDERLRMRLGEEARRTVVEKFSIDSVVDRYVDLYEGLLRTGP
jgi:glycosyltransferase involved in cell wall biosynthesis